MNFFKKNWFISLLFISPLLTFPWPEIGAYNGHLHAYVINKLAVMIIFLMNGITLKREILLAAVKKIRVTATIQLFSFLLAPLLAFIMIHTVFTLYDFPQEFITGTYILACLPTTIASCAIFTQMAGGDRSISLFNAVLSNFIGVLFAPFLLKFLLGINGNNLDFSPTPIIIEMLYLIVGPLLIGQLLHAHLKEQWWFTAVSKALLLFIVYSAFCNTFIEANAAPSPWDEIALLIVAMALLHGAYLSLAYLIGKSLFSDQKDTIAILFTAPQKTIAVGIPLSIALIEASGGDQGLGFTLLPLLMYNNIQWLAAGVLTKTLKAPNARQMF